MTICKVFVGSHVDYGDIIYAEAYNKTFHQKLEPIQYNVCWRDSRPNFLKIFPIVDYLIAPDRA